MHYVRNGIDKDVFAPARALEPLVTRPLRVLVEGNPSVWFKGVPEARRGRGRDARAAPRDGRHRRRRGARRRGVDRIVGPAVAREMAALYAE